MPLLARNAHRIGDRGARTGVEGRGWGREPDRGTDARLGENSMQFDFAAAEQYLRLLDKKARTFCFSWYPEKGTATTLPKELQFDRTIVTAALNEDIAYVLSGLNRYQRGIYVCLNKLGRVDALDVRTDANVSGIRAVFADFDDGLPDHSFPIAPTALVQTSVDHESGHPRYQAFWRCRGVSLDDFDAIERRLVLDWQADPASINRSRIQRLPGYYHQKHGVAFLVQILEARDVTYTREQIIGAFPPAIRPARKGRANPVTHAGSKSKPPTVQFKTGPRPVPYSAELARDLLSCIPAKRYAEYWPVVAAMKRWAGPDNAEAREITREWAQSEPAAYDEREFDQRWAREDEEREVQYTPGTLFHLARKGGWRGKAPTYSGERPHWIVNWQNGGKP